MQLQSLVLILNYPFEKRPFSILFSYLGIIDQNPIVQTPNFMAA
jgi:hypothetical protein